MPSCTTCGTHYKLSKEYSDPFECPDCLDVINSNNYDDYSTKESVEYALFSVGCSRTMPKFYEE